MAGAEGAREKGSQGGEVQGLMGFDPREAGALESCGQRGQVTQGLTGAPWWPP